VAILEVIDMAKKQKYYRYEERLERYLSQKEAVLSLMERGSLNARSITVPDYGLDGLRDMAHVYKGYSPYPVWRRWI